MTKEKRIATVSIRAIPPSLSRAEAIQIAAEAIDLMAQDCDIIDNARAEELFAAAEVLRGTIA
jgi:hypothetical protein